ncbi:SycD/LcrH family type III secretion system chaperone [Vibrio sp. TBV020]|uniref:SycD/LcrH family type III secretion system chaperone n=1 Tax=Vibrio sp. TBV020 TaxID=3137398 RepID=UPI0038CDB11F
MENPKQNDDISEEIMQFFNGGGTLAEIYDLSPTTLETLYQAGYQYYNGGSYKDAEKIFRFLCTFDHFTVKHFFALGSCLQMQRQYQTAIDTYSYASLIDSNDPRFPYHAAECQLMLGRKKEASSGFYAASLHKGKHSQFDNLCLDAAMRHRRLQE